MKNPLKYYIDKRIRKAFEEKARQEEKIKIEEREAKQRREREKEIILKSDKLVKMLITEGRCIIPTYVERIVNAPYEKRESTSIRKEIRRIIGEYIMQKLFVENSWNGNSDIEFTLSEGLKQDLQKLYNIK